MANPEFNIVSFLARWLFAAALVIGTYNPSEYSYVNWAFSDIDQFGPVMALVGVALLIAWVVFLRATLRSLGVVGIVLGAGPNSWYDRWSSCCSVLDGERREQSPSQGREDSR